MAYPHSCSRPGQRRLSAAGLSLVILVAFLGSGAAWAGQSRSARDLDYGIGLVPPHLAVDDATTFLVDFSDGRVAVEHAAGSSEVACANPQFVKGGGIKACFAIDAEKNINPRSWTVEMILRVPGGVRGDPTVAAWEIKGNYSAKMRLTGGGGPSCRIWAGKGGAGRRHEFNFSTHAGGNGFSLRRNAPDKWVYVAAGFDAASRRGNIVVRDMRGGILANAIWFAGNGGLSSSYLKGIADADKARVTEESWKDMDKCLGAGGLGDLTLGSPEVEVKRLRISRFRPAVVMIEPVPEAGDGRLLMPDELASGRAKIHTVRRRVGLNGYRNFQERNLEEKYIPMAAGDPPITVKLDDLNVGLYSFFVYGAIAAGGRETLKRVWRPCPMAFEVKNPVGKQVAFGRMLLKQAFYVRRMQGFHFHADTPGDYTATFRLADRALEKAEIVYMRFVDRLAGIPDKAVKTDQNLAAGTDPRQLAELTEARKARDDAIWEALPPLNTHLQVHGQCKEFRHPPAGYKTGTWQFAALKGIPYYRWEDHSFSPLTLLNEKTGGTFSHHDVLAGRPWPGEYPDDGCGIYFPKENTYYCPRAALLGQRYLGFAHNVTEHESRSPLARRYFDTGDPNVGHDAAMALVRLAYDWPALEMSLHEIRLCTHSPDFEYNTDWSNESVRNGKYYYRGWATANFVELMRAYDQLFPYIKGNQAFAAAVHRHIPWVKIPEDVVRMLDRYLVFAGVHDTRTGMLDCGDAVEVAAQVLGPAPETAPWFDLTHATAEIYPYKGRFQELYGVALSRCGSYYAASFQCYCFGDAASLLAKAERVRTAKAKGVRLPMDLSDVERYPKVKAAGRFLIDMWMAGGFPAMIGDASGGPHTGRTAAGRLKTVVGASRAAFDLWKDPRHAWLLKHLDGVAESAVAEAAAKCKRDPLLHNVSRVVPDYMAVVELGSDETDPLRKGAAMLRLGIGQGHAHNDYLDLNLFGMGLPLAVDLACRCEGGFWSRPAASWGFLHNHAQAHDKEDPRSSANQDGEPYLRSFEPPIMRAGYTNGKGDQRLDRDVVMMDIDDGDPATAYVFDLQRLSGGKMHTWCFHGCESHDLKLNVHMKAETVRWIDRTLKGTHKTGTAPAVLQAVWTMTREPKEYQHNFGKGGEVKTVACEKAVLGDRYDPNRPAVHVRATVLGRKGDAVLQGNPFSQSYRYCFPFLWVQNARPRGKTDVYPAVYEWYRGEVPALKSVKLASANPLTIKVTTASGQADTFMEKDGVLTVVSRDGRGLRWARLSGGTELKAEGLVLKAEHARYATPITAIDYVKRTLVTQDPLPQNPHAIIGSVNHRYLDLTGSGTSFHWQDDLLIHEGEITDVRIAGPDQIEVKTNQNLFHGNAGNRKLSGFTQVSEDCKWQLRGGRMIAHPPGVQPTPSAFADANGDGLVNLKTYEIGCGDLVEVLGVVTVRRVADGSMAVQTNVPVEGEVSGIAFTMKPSPAWQKVTGKPAAASPVRTRHSSSSSPRGKHVETSGFLPVAAIAGAVLAVAAIVLFAVLGSTGGRKKRRRSSRRKSR